MVWKVRWRLLINTSSAPFNLFMQRQVNISAQPENILLVAFDICIQIFPYELGMKPSIIG